MDKQVSKATDFSTTASAIFCGMLVHKSTFEKDVYQVLVQHAFSDMKLPWKDCQTFSPTLLLFPLIPINATKRLIMYLNPLPFQTKLTTSGATGTKKVVGRAGHWHESTQK